MAKKRQTVGPKLRFEVFKRDGFTCQYCGKKPPDVVLELDHIIAVSAGGNNDEENLLTSCFDCNRGKGGGDLTVAPRAVADAAERKKESVRQLREFQRHCDEQELITNQAADRVLQYWLEQLGRTIKPGEESFVEPYKSSVKNFIEKLTEHGVKHCVWVAAAKFPGHKRVMDDAFRYFCGVCWHRIREGQR